MLVFEQEGSLSIVYRPLRYATRILGAPGPGLGEGAVGDRVGRVSKVVERRRDLWFRRSQIENLG